MTSKGKYLGVPLFLSWNKSLGFREVKEKIQKKNYWLESQTLSQASKSAYKVCSSKISSYAMLVLLFSKFFSLQLDSINVTLILVGFSPVSEDSICFAKEFRGMAYNINLVCVSKLTQQVYSSLNKPSVHALQKKKNVKEQDFLHLSTRLPTPRYGRASLKQGHCFSDIFATK